MAEVLLDQMMEYSKRSAESPMTSTDELQVICQHNGENIEALRGGGPCTDDQGLVKIKTNKRWCIGKVPPHVREIDEKAYTPRIVSIGPFYHKEPALRAMEVHKLRFLRRLEAQIFQSQRQWISQNLEYLVMKPLEPRTRDCYSEQFEHISSNDFVRMLVLDACFIVELLRLNEKGSKGENADEYLFGTRWMLPIIGRDLLLMENQLPMFILQEVFNLTNFSDNPTPLDRLAVQFFKDYLRPLPGELSLSQGTNTSDQGSIGPEHLLALYHSTFVKRASSTVESSPSSTTIAGSSAASSSPNNNNNIIVNSNFSPPNSLPRYNNAVNSNVGYGNSLLQNSHSPSGNSNSVLPSNNNAANQRSLPPRVWAKNAKKLSSSGIRFSAEDDNDGLLVKFRRHELRIPSLLLGDDNYVHLLRNLLAYEQSSTSVSSYVTCFAIFLGSLVDTPEDIDVLLDKGIIKHAKGSNAKIAHLIKSLSWSHRYDMNDFYMIQQIQDINKLFYSPKAKIRRIVMTASEKWARFALSILFTYIFVLLQLMVYVGSDNSASAPARAPAP